MAACCGSLLWQLIVENANTKCDRIRKSEVHQPVSPDEHGFFAGML